MSDNEYSLKNMTKVINNILLPFFSQDLVDKNEKDYLKIVVSCIERCDIFKNAIFETLKVSFIFSFDDPYILSKLKDIRDEKAIESIFAAAFANFDVMPSAPTNLMTFANPLKIAGAEVIHQQSFDIENKLPDDSSKLSFINEKFYLTVKEKIKNQSNPLQRFEFDFLNALCFYFILNLIADCLYIQVTIIATGVVILLNANSDKPALIQDTIENILNKNILDFEKELDNFFENRSNTNNIIFQGLNNIEY